MEDYSNNFITYKTCSKCNITKSLELFKVCKSCVGGHRQPCKSCCSIERRLYYQHNKEKQKRQIRLWEQNNKKYRNLYNIRLKQKNRYNIHKDEYRLYRRKYVSLHLEERKLYNKNRKLIDPSFKLLKLLSNRVLRALKSQGLKKDNKISELIGCPIKFLKEWLEKQFLPGMSWCNHGQYTSNGTPKWQIDHIIPCSAFDLSDINQQKKCFNYKNLQPLWAIDNLIKSDNLPIDYQI